MTTLRCRSRENGDRFYITDGAKAPPSNEGTRSGNILSRKNVLDFNARNPREWHLKVPFPGISSFSDRILARFQG